MSKLYADVKSKPRPYLIEYFVTCRASISFGDMQLLQANIVSLLEEKTHLHGTAEAWIGRISIAMAKMEGSGCNCADIECK